MTDEIKLTATERETCISYNEAERQAVVFTCSPTLIRELDCLCEKRKDVRRTKTAPHGNTYRLPKVWITLSPGSGASE